MDIAGIGLLLLFAVALAAGMFVGKVVVNRLGRRLYGNYRNTSPYARILRGLYAYGLSSILGGAIGGGTTGGICGSVGLLSSTLHWDSEEFQGGLIWFLICCAYGCLFGIVAGIVVGFIYGIAYGASDGKLE